ncbi:hypothetical protein MA16_Dca019793 [Dendrobium catenatum]|uniref:Uncharacterized protein n=1 Tax=Dendrobium catenatum TaxID=906689 RepID=A0A2I0WEI1_9ASPA|nr:hypothetical protein MA16_Dca019793 [Dendrobium catenatum]
MRLLKWTPDYDVRHEFLIVPIWVSFPNLRLHFFNSQILFWLASILGRPLQMDQATASISHPSVARVLVEINISKKFSNESWLGSEVNGYFQKVEFENFPIFGSRCKMHGHSLIECFKLYPHLKKGKEIVKPTKMQECNTKADGMDNLVEGNGISIPAKDVVDQPVIQVIPSSSSNELNVNLFSDVGEGKNLPNDVIKGAEHSSSSTIYESLQNVTHVIVVEDNNIIDVNTNMIVENNNQVISVQGEELPLLVNSSMAHIISGNNLSNDNVGTLVEKDLVPSHANQPLAITKKGIYLLMEEEEVAPQGNLSLALSEKGDYSFEGNERHLTTLEVECSLLMMSGLFLRGLPVTQMIKLFFYLIYITVMLIRIQNKTFWLSAMLEKTTTLVFLRVMVNVVGNQEMLFYNPQEAPARILLINSIFLCLTLLFGMCEVLVAPPLNLGLKTYVAFIILLFLFYLNLLFLWINYLELPGLWVSVMLSLILLTKFELFLERFC